MLSCYVSLAVARTFRADLTNQRIMIILLCELGFLTGGEHGLDRNRATTRVECVSNPRREFPRGTTGNVTLCWVNTERELPDTPMPRGVIHLDAS